MSKNEERKDNLISLLRLKGEGCVGVREGIRGDGDGVSLLPHSENCRVRKGLPPEDRFGNRLEWCTCWMRSMAELERCLREMRLTARPLWYAVYERYIAAHRKTALVKVRRWEPIPLRNMHVIGLVNKLDPELNKDGTGMSRILVEMWRDGVEVDRVDAGIALLSGIFQGTPELPVEMMVKHAA